MSEEEKKEKTEEEILFSSVDINGITISPWTFGMLFDVSLLLERILSKTEQKNIDLDKIFSKGTLSYIDVIRLFTLATDEVLEVIAITIKKPIDEVKELDMSIGIKIALTIYNQNKDIIKNALSPL